MKHYKRQVFEHGHQETGLHSNIAVSLADLQVHASLILWIKDVLKTGHRMCFLNRPWKCTIRKCTPWSKIYLKTYRTLTFHRISRAVCLKERKPEHLFWPLSVKGQRVQSLKYLGILLSVLFPTCRIYLQKAIAVPQHAQKTKSFLPLFLHRLGQ